MLHFEGVSSPCTWVGRYFSGLYRGNGEENGNCDTYGGYRGVDWGINIGSCNRACEGQTMMALQQLSRPWRHRCCADI